MVGSHSQTLQSLTVLTAKDVDATRLGYIIHPRHGYDQNCTLLVSKNEYHTERLHSAQTYSKYIY